jgi:hypothetical protein
LSRSAASSRAWGYGEIQIEDERVFQEFCEEKREYWNYIDEEAVKNNKGRSQDPGPFCPATGPAH